MRARVCHASAVTCADEFLDLSYECQAFYYYLSFVADNDGFIDGIKRIARGFGVTMDDVKTLETVGLLMVVDGTYLITHWKCNNKTDNANYHPGTHINSLKKYVVIEDNKPYRFKADCGQTANSQETDVYINTHDTHESSPNESSSTEPSYGAENQQFEFVFQDPPTKDEVWDYAIREGLTFIDDGVIDTWYDEKMGNGWLNKYGEPLKYQVVESQTGEVLKGWQLYLKRLSMKMEHDVNRAHGYADETHETKSQAPRLVRPTLPQMPPPEPERSEDECGPSTDEHVETAYESPRQREPMIAQVKDEPEEEIPKFGIPEGAQLLNKCMCFVSGCNSECRTIKWHGASYWHCEEHGNLMHTDSHGNKVNQEHNQWLISNRR